MNVCDSVLLINSDRLHSLLAISTTPELETNELLLETIRARNKKAVIILRAHTIEDALKLYEAGANYVLTPHFLGGEYVAKMIKHSKSGDEDYTQERDKHVDMLKEILAKGDNHPRDKAPNSERGRRHSVRALVDREVWHQPHFCAKGPERIDQRELPLHNSRERDVRTRPPGKRGAPGSEDAQHRLHFLERRAISDQYSLLCSYYCGSGKGVRPG